MKLPLVGLDTTTAFFGLQTYESVNLQKKPPENIVHTSTKMTLLVSNCTTLHTYPKQHLHIGSRTRQALLHIESAHEVDELS